MLTIYFASIAHDLKAPLNSILASNSSLESNPDILVSSIASIIRIQKNSCMFMMNLIDDITDFSKI